MIMKRSRTQPCFIVISVKESLSLREYCITIYQHVHILTENKNTADSWYLKYSYLKEHLFLAYRVRLSGFFTWTDNYFLAYRIRISGFFTWTDNYFLAYRIRISGFFTWTDNYFLAYRIRISGFFTWTDNSFLAYR